MKVIDDALLAKGKQNIYDVLDQLGVRDAKAKIFDYSWEVPTGVPIFTVWAERVAVDPVSGRMFYVEPLEERTKLPSGAPMDAGQIKRHAERRRLIDQVRDGRLFIAVLQTNLRSREELQRDVTAKPDQRIKDSTWHVAQWDEARGRAILVRGEPGWGPTDDQVDEFIDDGRIQRPGRNEDRPSEVSPDSQIVLRFPDQAHRDRVEAASMKTMTEHFDELGLVAHDVSTENCGYDLDVKDVEGTSKHHVEVKGTSTRMPSFFITRNERDKSKSDPLWELAIVTEALGSDPQFERYSGSEIERLFSFECLAWRCDLILR